MDFNLGSNLLQAKTKGGQGKYNFGYLQITKCCSSKPMKVKKDKAHYFEMIDRTFEDIKNKIQLPLPEIPENLPKNIAPTERSIKKLLSKHKSKGFQSEVILMKFD